MKFYLASTSPARLALLRSSGIEPVLLPPHVDEDAVIAKAEASLGYALNPTDYVQLLARAKAEAVLPSPHDLDAHEEDIEGLVLGGDSSFVLDGVIYGKPHTAENARKRWREQRGKTGTLYSGHWLIDYSGSRVRGETGFVTSTEVTFGSDITDSEIDAYIATGEPLNVAGAFTIDSLGAAFITKIVGEPSTVVGLSLPALRGMVRELGYTWPDLWNRV
ncbi:nucleoside triphosphate pyrophosphatase [Lysinibacter sp. HNR]|uniref:Maf family protein n=1 Tax=Lysinibacter sp. HNR TaxID=3031408 RepID=UPI002435CC57|nr:nucleoside triphosphate pyrophosphatase [Lysinibacter sp. HNR]WGD38045.1 Maf family protein [Lysinibacter sp. HNR]